MDSTQYNTNPLEEMFVSHHTPDPCCLVIFGATGDLTKRKLIPALYNLSREGLLPENFFVIAFARKEKTDSQFREEMLEATQQYSRVTPIEEKLWNDFAQKIHYHQSNFDSQEGFSSLQKRLLQLDHQYNTQGNRIFYLSTHSCYFVPIIEQLKLHGLIYPESVQDNWSRVIVEKPFGRDLPSSIKLQKQISESLEEKQIFRIDHYLGKETVQNLLVFRFTNFLFASVWNAQHIDHVQITVSEEIGIGSRGAFFEKEGALRDMVQNHMTQLLTLVAMEPPASLSADNIRNEKVKVLDCLRPFNKNTIRDNVVRGHYSSGYNQGEQVKGYKEEDNVSDDSTMETFVALKTYIDNWRWSGTPFYLRTGKRLPKRGSEIAITFKDIPNILYQKQSHRLDPNVLVIRIQPDEGISLKMNCKIPGQSTAIQPVKMNFSYGDYFGLMPPEAYERLIYDCILGDSTLFARSDEVLMSWKWLTPILEEWKLSTVKEIPCYPAGSWGPQEAFNLLQADGRKWRVL
jgi:glucose-6-phosphate 1-dehydrogenase